MRRAWAFSAVLAAVATTLPMLLVAAEAPAAGATPVKIMPLGDSITDGWNVPGGYRIDLEDELVADGVAFDFVGSLANGPAALADKEHEGHGGWRIDQIASSINGWLATFQPDVVLLMIGTNDVLQDFQLATAPSRLASLLDQIHAARPQTELFVASIPPLPPPGNDQQVLTYNAAIPGIVQARADQGRPIRFVNVHPALTTADLADGIHPSAGGYSKIADVWHAALQPILGTNERPTATLTSPAPNASFAADADVPLAATAADSDGSIARVEFFAGATKLGEDATAPYELTWTNPPPGGHSLTARAVDDDGAGGTSSPVPITVAAASGEVLFRVNAGGPALAGSPGWAPDSAASPSSFGNGAATGNTTFSTTAAVSLTHASVPAGTPMALFQTERWDAAGGPEMEWDFPVGAAGEYDLRLYFAEIWSGAFAVGARRFDVRVEGSLVLDDYDVFADVGANRGVVKSFRVTSDAVLDVDFLHVLQNPAVKALEVVAVGAPPQDTTAPTVTGRVPAAGASGVSAGAMVEATFSEPLEPASVSGSSFRLARVTAPAGAVTATVSYDGPSRTARLDPTASLEAGVEYRATLVGGAGAVRDLAGNELASEDSWSFTIASAPPPDTTPPTVTGRAPAAGASGVSASAMVEATFSEPMAPASVSGSSFRLARVSAPGSALAATVSYDAASRTARLDPSASLEAGVEYRATVVGGAAGVRDVAGVALVADDSWTFTVAAAPVPGEVLFRVNAGGPAQSGTPGWAADSAAAPSSLGNGAATGNTTFSTTAAVSLTHASVPAGTPMALFQTERWDASGGPELMWDFPVTAGQYELRLYFAEIWSGAFAAGARLFDVRVEGALVLDNYDVFAEVGANRGVVKSFTVTSDAVLDVDFLHVLQNPAIKAIEVVRVGAPLQDTTAPTVTERVPDAGASGVAAGVMVEATFSEPVNPATVTGTSFRLVRVSAPASPLAATVSYDAASRTARLDPSADLEAGVEYRATVLGGSAGVRDPAGNELATDESWTFTVAAAPPLDTTAPTVTGRVPASGASGMSAGTMVEATFSEPVNPASVSVSSFQLARVTAPAGAVAATVSYDGPSRTARLDPTASLEAGVEYRATVVGGAGGVRDPAGNALAADDSWTFTVAAAAPPGGSSLYRAVNIGGPALTIDGVVWEATTAPNVVTNGFVWQNQSLPVVPDTDAARATMLRSASYNQPSSMVSLLSVPAASYDVFLWIWEDNNSSTVDIRVEGQLVRQGYPTGSAGHWERLGPWRTAVADGRLDVSAGPDANLSGLEVYRVASAPAAPIFVGAGDIATVPAGASGPDEETAKLLDAIVAAAPGNVTVFAAGDAAYEDGTAAEFASFYEPTWGRHKAITRPVPGNHEYHTPGATGYYGYFGAAAGDPAKGYYAYDLGAWRIYALNSNIARGAGSEQEQWLRADLAAHPGVGCVLAYLHHPRFSSGTHGGDASQQALWQALYDHGADVVVAAHDHDYERFGPQTPTGASDPANGLVQFVVGTGGGPLRPLGAPVANSQTSSSTTHGVLELTLQPSSYSFRFVPVAASTYTDAGQHSCD